METNTLEIKDRPLSYTSVKTETKMHPSSTRVKVETNTLEIKDRPLSYTSVKTETKTLEIKTDIHPPHA